MMTIFGIPPFELATLAFALIAITLVASARSKWAKRRVLELQITENALRDHYEAVEAIADEEDLPLEVLAFLNEFGEAIAKRETCEKFARDVYMASTPAAPSPMFRELEELDKVRPDIVDNVHKAVLNGIMALYLRWPGYSIYLQIMMQQMAADRRKELRVAETIVRANAAQHAGDLVPA